MQSGGKTSSLRSAVVLVGWIGLCQLVGAFGALFSDPGFYRELVRPRWAPPPWVFAPVWVTLYTVMAVAAWLVWRTGPGRGGALTWFAIQLALNAAWSPVFFGLRAIGSGLVVIAMLEIAILATTVAFAERSRLAAIAMLPYAAWVAFAMALNAALWLWNP